MEKYVAISQYILKTVQSLHFASTVLFCDTSDDVYTGSQCNVDTM